MESMFAKRNKKNKSKKKMLGGANKQQLDASGSQASSASKPAAVAASNDRVSALEQAEFVGDVATIEMKLGEVWYAFSAKWYGRWRKWVDPELPDAKAPGPITNKALQDQKTSRLKSGLQERSDFVLVPERIWTKLLAWHGLDSEGAVLRGEVTWSDDEETQLHVDLRPMSFEVHVALDATGRPDMSAKAKTLQVNRSTKMGALADACKSLVGKENDAVCRVWYKSVTQGSGAREWGLVATKDVGATVRSTLRDDCKWTLLLETRRRLADGSSGEWPRSEKKLGDLGAADEEEEKWHGVEVPCPEKGEPVTPSARA